MKTLNPHFPQLFLQELCDGEMPNYVDVIYRKCIAICDLIQQLWSRSFIMYFRGVGVGVNC